MATHPKNVSQVVQIFSHCLTKQQTALTSVILWNAIQLLPSKLSSKSSLCEFGGGDISLEDVSESPR